MIIPVRRVGVGSNGTQGTGGQVADCVSAVGRARRKRAFDRVLDVLRYQVVGIGACGAACAVVHSPLLLGSDEFAKVGLARACTGYLTRPQEVRDRDGKKQCDDQYYYHYLY